MKTRAVLGIMLTLLLISMLTLAFNIQSVTVGVTIYIMADGSVDPSDAPISSFDNMTYTFACDLIHSIVIERDNIVVDGAGYGVYGIKNRTGIYLSGRSNVTIKNMEINGFETGIWLDDSSNNNITGNNITNNWLGGVFLYSSSNNVLSRNNVINNGDGIYLKDSSNCNRISGNNIVNNWLGIWLDDSSNNRITGNNITANHYDGFSLINSPNNTLRNNSMANNRVNFGVWCYNLSDFVNDVDPSNTVDDKPIYYWINKQDMVAPLDAGYVALVNCTRITIQNLNLTNNLQGVLLAYTTNSTIIENNIEDNDWGIALYYSLNNTMIENNIEDNNDCGILLYWSLNNTISGNNITNNFSGIQLSTSSSNIIYHNNFGNYWRQVYSYASVNVWDDGYPSGGNYWSDYNGTDFYIGPHQNETGSDGIGDTPYFIDVNNQDNYPLMSPWTPAPPTAVVATADVVPDTLNLKSKGKWITCYIELSEGYNVSDIDVSTVMLNETFPVSLLDVPAPKPVPTEIGDHNNNGVPDLMVKFNRTTLTSHIYHTLDIKYGNVTLTISGELSDGTPFEGNDTIKMMFGGDADSNGLIDLTDFCIWKENYGKTPEQCPPDVHPDFDNNELVEMLDFYTWRENFGATIPPQP